MNPSNLKNLFRHAIASGIEWPLEIDVLKCRLKLGIDIQRRSHLQLDQAVALGRHLTPIAS
jgi:hypothetical protein